MTAAARTGGEGLSAWAVFSGVIAAAGLPIYLFAPAYYAETYGVSLGTLGLVLFCLRLFDVVQDPALGWITERLGARKGAVVAGAGAVLALSMLGLFAVTPPIAPVWWFALMLVGLFTAFSFLSIAFYAQGIARAATLPGSHTRLAAWRESGGLVGVCLAAVLPTTLALVSAAPQALFAWGFALAVALAVWLMAGEWAPAAAPQPTPVRTILADRPARGLLWLAFVNAAPLAVTSTLFLFFVEYRLAAPGWEGPLLLAFFLTAALSSPLWARAARRWGERQTLRAAMVAAILTFGWALTLGPGDVAAFTVICLISGATIGADLTLMPAMFARRMAVIAPNGGQGFGLWAFMNKATLAVAAIALLPLLQAAGFQPGQGAQPDNALTWLLWLYAGLPCALKMLAIGLLTFAPADMTS